MTIDELAKLRANSVPNSILVQYYEAGIPQWHMETILTMLKPKKLSVLQEFILKFVFSGIDDVSDICNFLGIKKTAVNNAVAILQKNNLLIVDIFYSRLKLTNKGKEALKEATTIVPEDIEYALYMDGLLGNVYLDTRKLYTSKELHKLGIKSINIDVEKPTLESLVYGEVKRAINFFKKSHAYEKDKLEGDLQEVSRVVKTYVEYKKVNVLVFMNKSEDIEFQVYDGATRNDDYSIAFQKQYYNHTLALDLDTNYMPQNGEDNSLINILPREIIESAKSFSYKDATLEREISNLTTQLDKIKNNDDEEDEKQKESATERIRFLERKIAEMENERKVADRILSTYDHRPLLLDTLDNAQNTVVIISPWIKSSGLNNEILGRIERALQRNTKVIIGYGISEKEDSDRWVLQKLSDMKKKRYGNKLLLVRLSNTHEKVLIKDNEYMVITSFNWLSFRGSPNKGFRQETGYYTESKEAIKQMKDNLSNRMNLKI